MNQSPRFIERTCIICKEHTVMIKQTYDTRISDWRDCQKPICEECWGLPSKERFERMIHNDTR